MSERVMIAVPSEAPGGLDAKASGHFGHCDAYTIITVLGSELSDVKVHLNEGHEHGNCLAPVLDLAKQGVSVLIAGGMGQRPLHALHESGIEVYYSNGLDTVAKIIEAFSAGKLQKFAQNNLCQGNCNH